MSNSIDNQLNGSRSIPKTNLNNPSNKAERALLQEDSNNNVQTPTVIKRRGGGGTFSLDKKIRIQKAPRKRFTWASLGKKGDSFQ